MGELVEGDQRVAVLRPVVIEVPIDENADGGEADIDADHHVPEEDPRRDELVVAGPGRFRHDVLVRRVEAESRGGRAVRDEVHPEELHGDHALRDAQQGSQEDGGHLADVGADEVADEGLHVGVNGPTLLNRRHDGGEVVVRQDHVRRLLRHLRARDAHGDTDGRLLERRRVVDAVAGHGGHLPLLPQHAHELLLVARLRAREDARAASVHEQAAALLEASGEEVRAGEGLVGHVLALLEDADLLGDGLGGVLGVARDHDDADPRHGTLLDGPVHLRARGVLDAHEPEKSHARLDAGKVGGVREGLVRRVRGGLGGGVVRERTEVLLDGAREDAQGPARHLVHLGHDAVARRGGELHVRAVDEALVRATAEHGLRGALDEELRRLHLLARLARQLLGALHGCHEHTHRLAVAGKLEEGLVRVGAAPLVAAHRARVRFGLGALHRRQAHLLHEHAQGRLGRLAEALVLVVLRVVDHFGLVAEGANLGQGEESALRRGGLAPVQALDAALGAVARALDLVLKQLRRLLVPRVDEGHGGHLVCGEGARLVRADHRGAPQGLHGRELAHDGVLLDHLARAQAEAEGDDGRQPLWDGGDAKRDGNLHVVDAALDHAPVHGVEELAEVHHPHEEADPRDHLGEHFAEGIELLPERRLLLLLGRGLHVRLDLTNLRLHARGHHEGHEDAV
mmetsp:Transcript_17038/g.49349  ORF Transcript_17038/g.49349 Transcript_17038/m.49349 type:complete len:683 (+) Transcript_17038:872-2920(+)